jgi:2-polyprenyl-3-methyl-5-hydroxy-6-metoxy-1,4-benzoquinol methylase
MLSYLSKDRVITGVDYDEEKIETAKHSYSNNDRLNFEVGDVTNFALKTYDAIVIADVLHYLQPEAQASTVRRAIQALLPGGTLIIRDGNAELKERHQGTQLTEFFSVKVLKFNKSTNELHFLNGKDVLRIASEFNCTAEIIDDTKFTSNVIFVIRKNTHG